MTLVDALDERARSAPERPLFHFHDAGGRRSLSHGDLVATSTRAALALAERGVGRRDRVALVLGTGPALVSLIVACQRLAAVPVVMSPAWPMPALARRRELVGARLVVDELAAEGLMERDGVGGPVADARPEDWAFMQLTSGTSGEPRPAVLSHANVLESIEASGELMGIGPEDRFAAWVPIHHDLGLVRFVLTPIAIGAEVHLLPPTIASVRPWIELLAAERITVTGAPDFAYRLAARTVSPLALPALRVATNGGEPVRASTIDAFERRFSCLGAVRPGYGLAEATLGVTGTPPGRPVVVDGAGHVSCGGALPRVGLRVVDERGAEVRGAVGEIQIRGPSIFEGYWDERRSQCDRASFVDGWHRTGDCGYLDEAGALFVLGRARVMLKRAGVTLAPRELEEVADLAGQQLGVRFSAAVAVTREGALAEALVLVVEARLGADAAAIERTLSSAVATELGLSLDAVFVVDPGRIPLTANGKIRHQELARLIEVGEAPFDRVLRG